jgi:hypothetical protein
MIARRACFAGSEDLVMTFQVALVMTILELITALPKTMLPQRN